VSTEINISASELFLAIAKYHKAMGLPPMNQMDGAWVEQVDEHWWFAVNGQLEPLEMDGLKLDPHHVLVKFNGWPAGIFTPQDGFICAGKLANGGEFIAALEMRRKKP